MARPRKARQPTASDLARLTIDPHFVLEGGQARLPVWVREGDGLFQPFISLWLDSAHHTVRSFTLVNPSATSDDARTETLNALIQACAGPFAPPDLPLPPALPAGGESPTPTELMRLLASVSAGPTPALPARVHINDVSLADMARAVFEPLGVAVEYTPALQPFDEALAGIVESMGGPQNEPPQPFAWDLDDATLEPLFTAAAAYWRRKPWDYMDDYPPVVIQLGENGPRPDVPVLFASILGGAGEVFGVAFYYSADTLDRLVQRGEELLPPPEIEDAMLDQLAQVLQASGAPAEGLSRAELRTFAGELMSATGMSAPTSERVRDLVEDSLAVFFSPADETDPTYLQWLAAHNLKYPARRAVPSFLSVSKDSKQGRLPDAREARALTLALDALVHFFRMFHRALETGPGPFLAIQRLLGMSESEEPRLDVMPELRLGDERVRVPVSYTVPLDLLTDEGDVEEEEELPPPSESAPTTLYRFHVALEWKPDVWRRIEMRGDQTLEDLHDAIQDAFGWDNDHLYSFYLSGKAFDERTEYCSPYADCERHVSSYRLENIPLKPRKKLLYLFDYGDELRHTVTVEAITRGGVEPRKKYPRIAERHGRNVQQYPVTW